MARFKLHTYWQKWISSNALRIVQSTIAKIQDTFIYIFNAKSNTFETNLFPQKHLLIKISDDEEENIYLGSPFYGAPNFSEIKTKVNTLLILDLNILSDLRHKKTKKTLDVYWLGRPSITPKSHH